jgi:hypothetical protein
MIEAMLEPRRRASQADTDDDRGTSKFPRVSSLTPSTSTGSPEGNPLVVEPIVTPSLVMVDLSVPEDVIDPPSPGGRIAAGGRMVRVVETFLAE